MNSFLSSVGTFLKRMPDHRPKDLASLIRPKCSVLHFPLRFPNVTRKANGDPEGRRALLCMSALSHLTKRTASLTRKPGERRMTDPALYGTSVLCFWCCSVRGGNPPPHPTHHPTHPPPNPPPNPPTTQPTQHPTNPPHHPPNPPPNQPTGMHACGLLPEHKLLRRPVAVSRPDDDDIVPQGQTREPGRGPGPDDGPEVSRAEELSSRSDQAARGAPPETREPEVPQGPQTSVPGQAPGPAGGEEQAAMMEGCGGRWLEVSWRSALPSPSAPLEHDKDPELFFETLLKLKERNLSFQLSVLGETFTDVPEIFTEARGRLEAPGRLGPRVILHWGFLPGKEDYLAALCQADVVVSTAKHEFFGVAMLEAVHCGCYPLCPNSLVYPDIFPAEYLYSTPEQLCKKLQRLCKRPDLARRHCVQVDTTAFSWDALQQDFTHLLAAPADPPP
ncbi:hypothetical protein NHX12_006647 [Muraenolepis orangiensis]|uniref:tRNA-queuosine alpha-mannosyltransferase n=1 Tax=Muraenolepis orangiensis TaxID=630683 RepID=A0A9Q0DQ39_9TELE|nr:hypothetical protein NHX12_006647 [Muraenolepis orangiensis]